MIRSIFRTRLGLKFVTVAAAALVLAASVFLALYEGLFWWLLNSAEREAFWKKQGRDAIADFQQYVTLNRLTVDETIRDVDWETEYETTYLYMVDASDTNAVKEIRSGERAQGTKVKCADGSVLAFAHRSFPHYDRRSLAISLLAAICSFFIILIPYVLRTIHRITHLSDEMAILTGGDLSYSIVARGSDELAELGYSIEAMRLSVLSQMAAENEAVLANSRLITSLSHDLRTPLTRLTGYLEILELGGCTEEERKRYLAGAIQNARQMKTLSDEMFRSFEVTDDGDFGFETVSGPLLLSQLTVETCCDLESAGFKAAPPVIEGDFSLKVRVFDIRRIFDNIFSNIKKYADSTKPVLFSFRNNGDTVTLSASNSVSPDITAGGMGIGLPTVNMLAVRNRGSAAVTQTDREFTIEITLPIE